MMEQDNPIHLLVLREARPMPGFDNQPDPERIFDERDQIWLWRSSGTPVVEHPANAPSASEYGETLITATSEGVDQSEGTAPSQSEYGETSMTKTSEGVDQSEGGSSTATLF